jgi:sec-independent protein translocase protein TatC
MSLVEHLTELRSRIIRAALAYLVAAVLGFIYFRPILRFLEHPYCRNATAHVFGPGRCSLVINSPIGSFSVALHVALIVGAVGSAPVWLYQLWAFITPGLRRGERTWAIGFVGSGLVLFGVGAGAGWLILPRAMSVLLDFGRGVVVPLVTIDQYLSFLTTLLLVFGVAFEFPLVVVMLNLTGLVSYQRLRHWRRMEIFAVTVFAAIAVPSPDPLSMLACAVPMALLYEVALGIARLHDARKARRAAVDSFADLPDDIASPAPLRMGQV